MEDGVAPVTSVAQRASRRSLSSPIRAESWAWKRRLMSFSDLEAETNTVVRPPSTTPMITITVSISTSV